MDGRSREHISLSNHKRTGHARDGNVEILVHSILNAQGPCNLMYVQQLCNLSHGY